MVQDWSLTGKLHLTQPYFKNVHILRNEVGVFQCSAIVYSRIIFAGSLEKGNIFFFKNVLKIIISEKGILVNG